MILTVFSALAFFFFQAQALCTNAPQSDDEKATFDDEKYVREIGSGALIPYDPYKIYGTNEPKHCYFYGRNNCKNGDNCLFWHDKTGEYWTHYNQYKRLKKKEAKEKNLFKDGYYICPPSNEPVIEERESSLGPRALPEHSLPRNSYSEDRRLNERQKQWEEHVKRTEKMLRRPCYFFERFGMCKRGNNCAFLHAHQRAPMMPYPQFVPQNFCPHPYYAQIPVIDSSVVPYLPQNQPWQVIIIHNGVPTYSEYLPFPFLSYPNLTTNNFRPNF